MTSFIIHELIFALPPSLLLADQRSGDEGLARHPKDVRPAQLEGGPGCRHDLRPA